MTILYTQFEGHFTFKKEMGEAVISVKLLLWFCCLLYGSTTFKPHNLCDPHAIYPVTKVMQVMLTNIEMLVKSVMCFAVSYQASS